MLAVRVFCIICFVYLENLPGGGGRSLIPQRPVYLLTQVFALTTGFCTNLDEYLRRISTPSKFRPFGELLHVYTQNDLTFEVYKVICTCMCQWFREKQVVTSFSVPSDQSTQ